MSSNVVSAVGVPDITKISEVLTTPEDIGTLAAIVGLMGRDELERRLTAARASDQLATSEITDRVGNQSLVSFLNDYGEKLQNLAFAANTRLSAVRALARGLVEGFGAGDGKVVNRWADGVATYYISGPVIGSVMGDVHVTQAAPIEIQPPPAPTPPPVPAGFAGRERELELYSEKVRTTGQIVITGMPGVGKTALAAKVALNVASASKIFWHTFRPGEAVDLLLWELAGFAAWHAAA
ncbi:MAG: hypothetical protein U0X20_20390 [Caldilineaceae bacterium]